MVRIFDVYQKGGQYSKDGVSYFIANRSGSGSGARPSEAVNEYYVEQDLYKEKVAGKSSNSFKVVKWKKVKGVGKVAVDIEPFNPE